MQRITISLDDVLGEEIDRMVRERGYESRSEAMRDLVRGGLERWRNEQVEGSHCVANLSYVVDRRVRALPQRIADMQHSNHYLVAASMVVRLDHFHSFESVILKGATTAVTSFADQVRTERGVKLSSVNLVQVEPTDAHPHADDHEHHGHHHLSPLN